MKDAYVPAGKTKIIKKDGTKKIVDSDMIKTKDRMKGLPHNTE